MFAFKKSRTLLAHTFSFLSRAPRRERLSSICGHKISMWSFCSGFASWLISPKPTLTDKSRVCVPVCVCLCVCGHATGVNPWQRADNSLSGHSGSVWTVNVLPHACTQPDTMHQAFFPPISAKENTGTCIYRYTVLCICVCVSVWMCGCERVGRGDVPCSSALGSHDSPGWHIHLCLFAKFDFKYLSRHTSWLKQIAGKVLLSVKHVVRRMEALEGTSMFHLAKYMTEEVYVQPQHFSTQEGDNGGKNFLKCIRGRRASVWRSQSRSL